MRLGAGARGPAGLGTHRCDRTLPVLAAAVLTLGGVQLALTLPGSGGLWWVQLVVTATFWVFAGAGLLAWHRRPGNRMGMLLVWGGLAVFAGTLGNTAVPALAAAGAVTATVVLAVTVHLLLAFPSGRVHGAPARAVVVAGYAVSLLLQAPQYLFDPSAAPALSVADSPGLVTAGTWVQRAAGAVVVVAAAVLLARRIAAAHAAHRRVLVPLFAYGMLALLSVPLRATVLEPAFGAVAAAVVQFAVLGGVPVAFVLAMLRGGFAREGELEELAAQLAATDDARADLPALLGRALGDPSVEVLYWMPRAAVWTDGSGALRTLPLPEHRASVEVSAAGERIGAIVYDGYLIADPEPVRAAGRVMALAIERERLLARLLAQRGALIASRARIVTAADRERRRVARDLHDGMQVRLVLLALEAQRLAAAADGPAAGQALALRRGLDETAARLRSFVHELMPSALIERGLCAAAEDLVDRMPVPTALHAEIADGALPPDVESTAYFLIAEGLTNALKHAHAGRLSVRIGRDGDAIVVEVHDDGVGGASLHTGHGLRGLADRVHALGGGLRVDSATGCGTHLRAELPCGDRAHPEAGPQPAEAEPQPAEAGPQHPTHARVREAAG
ncbi:sensor histidine kinase [Tomitella fengzijianii]|uniref:sensor histidine kinase n=1 Tax=Tomitella fengzijianii TaxID=2597660 RepID=UPI00131E28EB|nr:histidine kinase [Tomitella fengzijianii]